MTLQELEINGLVAKAHFAKAQQMMAEHKRRVLGLQEKSRNPALDSLQRQALKGADRATAENRTLDYLLAGSGANYELELSAHEEGAERVLAELRGELGMGPPALPAPRKSSGSDDGSDAVDNIMKEPF